MSIRSYARLALSLAILLTLALGSIAWLGDRVSRQSNAVVGRSLATLQEQDRIDSALRQLRSDLGKATRTVEHGRQVPPVTWADLLDQAGAVESAVRSDTGSDQAFRMSALAAAASAKTLVAGAETGAVTPGLVTGFAASLRGFEQERDRLHHRLASGVRSGVDAGFQASRLWNLLLICAATLAAFVQLGFAFWLKNGVAAPLERLSSVLQSDDDRPVASADLARADEVGTLARATAEFRSAVARRTESARELQQTLRLDALTGLLGRQAFDELLTPALANAGGDQIAFVTLDLDRFKEVNDTKGHAGGDAVLRRVSIVLRDVCDGGEIIGRLGGDEFAVVKRFGKGEDSARRLSRRLLEAFEDARISVSLGVALYPSDAMEETRLRHYSDLALYRAKHEGRGRACFFNTGHNHATGGAAAFVPLPSELRDAIATDELLLHYQPKMRARTGEIDSIEALVRWQHNRRGLVAPDAFIPVAEKMGHIRALTEWTLHKAVADQARLADAGHDLPIYVNISACLLGDPDFARAALNIVMPRARSIGFEITETAVIEDPEHALAHLQEFVDAGVRIAIDDYGAGMSSLSYLKRLPAHELKIDRAFVAELSRSHRDPLIVRSTIDLAHALGLKVTAEGVEKLSSFALLRAMGCDLIQGYLVARPVAFDGLLTFLNDSGALAHLGGADLDVRSAGNW